jgi:hypothetical protein
VHFRDTNQPHWATALFRTFAVKFRLWSCNGTSPAMCTFANEIDKTAIFFTRKLCENDHQVTFFRLNE